MITCPTLVVAVFDTLAAAEAAAKLYQGFPTIFSVTSKVIVNTNPANPSTSIAGPQFVLIVQ